MTEPKRINDINKLSPTFRQKYDAFMLAVLKRWNNVIPFETLRTLARQKWLYGVGRTHSMKRKPITWTMESRHLVGEAVDLVFNTKDGPSWVGPYQDMITLAPYYGLDNLAPTETCHFQDDRRSIEEVMKKNSRTHDSVKSLDAKRLTHEANENFRAVLKKKPL